MFGAVIVGTAGREGQIVAVVFVMFIVYDDGVCLLSHVRPFGDRDSV